MVVLDAFSIFNAEEFPPDSASQQFSVYGYEEMQVLKEHYGTENEVEQWEEFRFEMVNLRKKWFNFKSQIEGNCMKLKVTATEWTLKQIVQRFSNNPEYGCITYYAKLALVIPATNAWPERGASAVKRIKSRMRSRMKMDLLNGLLHISINGPSYHSQEAKNLIVRAAQLYNVSTRHRKPQHSKYLRASNPSIGIQTEEINLVEEAIEHARVLERNLAKEISAEHLRTNFELADSEDDDDGEDDDSDEN